MGPLSPPLLNVAADSVYQKPVGVATPAALKAKARNFRYSSYQIQVFLVHCPMRIALYARVSTKDKGQDYENQLRELREFVAHKTSDGWVLAREYVDRASGKKPLTARPSSGFSKTHHAASSIRCSFGPLTASAARASWRPATFAAALFARG
jgi:hypothetical protein